MLSILPKQPKNRKFKRMPVANFARSGLCGLIRYSQWMQAAQVHGSGKLMLSCLLHGTHYLHIYVNTDMLGLKCNQLSLIPFAWYLATFIALAGAWAVKISNASSNVHTLPLCA